MQTVKLLSNNVTLGASANDIFQARVAYITNSNTTVGALITQANSTVNTGVIVVPPLGSVAIVKAKTDTFVSNLTSGVFSSAIGFSG